MKYPGCFIEHTDFPTEDVEETGVGEYRVNMMYEGQCLARAKFYNNGAYLSSITSFMLACLFSKFLN